MAVSNTYKSVLWSSCTLGRRVRLRLANLISRVHKIQNFPYISCGGITCCQIARLTGLPRWALLTRLHVSRSAGPEDLYIGAMRAEARNTGPKVKLVPSQYAVEVAKLYPLNCQKGKVGRCKKRTAHWQNELRNRHNLSARSKARFRTHRWRVTGA